MLGGFLGGIARFYLSGRLGLQFGERFPWGTLGVNVTGCFAIGLLAGVAEAGGALASPLMRDFLIVGFCGGYTTVSSFALQTLDLGRDGENRAALLNIAATTLLCLLAVAAGSATAMALVP